jgi:hypothetical protein
MRTWHVDSGGGDAPTTVAVSLLALAAVGVTIFLPCLRRLVAHRLLGPVLT